MSPRHCDREHRADQAQDHDGRHNELWLVGAWQPGFGLNCGNIARRQLEPRLQDFLSGHAFHVSSEFSPGSVSSFSGTPSTFSHMSRPERNALRHHSVSCLSETSGCSKSCSFDVEFLKDFAQPFDRRIALHPHPATTCRKAHR